MCFFALSAIGLLWAGSAIAAPPLRVLVLPDGRDGAAAASLAEALRIQLGAQGTAKVGDMLLGSNLSGLDLYPRGRFTVEAKERLAEFEGNRP